MPGPGRHKQKKSKSTGGRPGPVDHEQAYRLPSSYVTDIEDAVGWTAAADMICHKLDIPDLETRSGLKKVHKDFSSIYKRLDDLYAQFNEVDRIAGGVVGIYAKMCSDSILRNRLFHEKDLLTKLISLLDRPALRTVSLQALSVITHHGGADIRIAIARKTSALLKLLEEQPDNSTNAELAMVVLSHSTSAALCQEKLTDPGLIKIVDVPRLLRVFVAQIRKPTATSLLLDHAMSCLTCLTFHCNKEFKKVPSAINLLVACLRSTDVHNRGIGMGGLIRFHVSDSEVEVYTSDPMIRLKNMQRGVPSRLGDPIMNTCGPMESEMYRTMNAASAFAKTMMSFAQDRNRDFVKLGVELGKLILTSENALSGGAFEAQDPRTGRFALDDLGLGFIRWSDSLPLCAKALREKGTPEMLDLADMLQLKYMVTSQKTIEAQPLAKLATERSPKVGFFYYIRALNADPEDALRCAKKGLKCPNLTTYVRFALLLRGCEHAINLGISILGDSHIGDQRWHEAIAFLVSAYEDTCTFIEHAPPDSRGMKDVMYMNSILTLAIKGGEIGPDLLPLRNMDDNIKRAEEYTVFMGGQIRDVQFRKVRSTVLARMEEASKEWDEVIANFPHSRERDHVNEVKREKAGDDFSAWLENMNLEDDDDDAERAMAKEHMRRRHPKVSLDDIDLYRCSWCQNPSAVLRKCSSCEKARYCDATCQKDHWSAHKKTCKRTA